ncbi:MAG: ABC transporter ATP-binding protein [Candidatus Thorarchaeota archaeon]|nr:ABC transporter ATP-binding protein [Candidatus Thorarchaeota archaeon]
MSKLSVRDVSKAYHNGEDGETKVLDDISFEVGEKEFLSILGPSGCGKTTLLKIIAGLMEPDSGTILIDNKEETLGHNRVALIFQQASLFPWLTVRKNIEFGLEIHGVEPGFRKSLVNEMISLVGIEGLEDHYPHEISGGQARKTEMARSLVTSPDVLASDEGFSNLDAQTRNYIQEEFLRVWEETGSTILFVTHNVDEAVFMSDRILVMSNVPAKIIAEYEVDLPRPRVRASSESREVRAKILEVLKAEQEKALQIQ